MVDRPGAGNSRSYKIRGYTRERHSAKPYARPSERKSVLQTVKDFFSPSWLVDFFQGSRRTDTVQVDDNDEETKSDSVLRDFEQSSATRLTRSHQVAGEQVGNGQMGSMMFRPGYFSSALREHEPPNDALSSSKPPRTVGLSSASVIGESSTITRRSEEPDTRVPRRSRDEEGLFVSKETTMGKEEEDNPTTSTDQEIEERTRSNPIQTSTPAFFSCSANTKRPRTSFLGHPMGEGPVAPSETPYRSVLMPTTESRPQPFAVPKNRPSFSLSAFGSPLPPRPSQSGGLSSTFYLGRTSFGGASSFHSSGYKRARVGSPSQGEIQQPVRKQIKPKPVTTVGSSSVTSQTAKRILEALESMSSPLIDARKIPTPPASPSASLLSFSPSKRKRPPITSRTVGSPRSLQAHFGGPPVQDLSAPQRASISGTRGKASANPSTTQTSASLFSTGTTTIPTFSKPSMPSFTPTPLPISLSPSSSENKAGGKVKSVRSTSHYTQRGKLEDMREEVVNPLPELTAAVPLPLPNGKSLPTFSFSSALSNETTVATSTKTAVTMDNLTKTTDITKNNFKFSEPQTKLASSSQPPKKGSGSNPSKITFSFSNPEPVNERTAGNFPVSEAERAPNAKNKTTQKITELNNNNLLKKFAPPLGSWTCDTCLVSNRATDTKCVACQSAKPASEKTPAKKAAPLNNDLFQKFAPPPGSWSCNACMISNKESDHQCAACGEPKPGVKAPLPSEKPVVSSGEDLKKKFAPPEGSWSCDTCMVTNKATDSSCAACQSVKAGDSKATTTSTSSRGVLDSFGPDKDLAAKFVPPPGSWNCDSCMIDNKAESSSCAACQTPKPGAKPSSTTSLSFGVSSSSMSDKTLAAKFAQPPGSWSCDTCLVDNKAENVTCVACQTPKPGAKPTGGEQASSLPFQFGLKDSKDVKKKEESSSSSSLPFKFGAGNPSDKESTTQSVTPTLFNFGAGSSLDNNSKGSQNFGTSEKDDDKAQLPVTFRFGGAPPSFDSVAGTTREEDPKKTNISFGFGTANQTVTSKKEETKVPPFSFGSKTLSEKDNVSVGGFSFGVNNKEKPNTIAAATAAGFLKVSSELKDQEKNATEQSSGQAGAGMTIAAAAKAGMLKVPTVEEKKGDIASPPNVNLFTSTSSTAKASLPGFMPPDKTGSSGFSFTASPSASFTFGAAQTVAASTGGDSKPASSNVQFSFGGGSSASSSSTTASSFSFTTNPLPLATAGAAPFGSQVSSAVPTTTAPAMPFSFTTPAQGAATTAASNTVQSSSLTPLASSGQSAAPQGSFSFGRNLAPATNSTTPGQGSQTFGIRFDSGNSTSEPRKPFSFNAATGGSSMQQGFSFASAKPPVSSSPFTFGGSVSKSNFNFGAGFGASQQSAANTPFVFGAAVPSPASDETMDADGNNSTTTIPGGGLFGSTGAVVGNTFGSSGSIGGFSFGSQTAVPSAGSFNFGAAQQSNTSQSAFAFGANTGTAPTFGGNTAPSAHAPGGGGFDFSAAATNMASSGGFNFGGGGNATPQGGPMFTVGTPGEQSNPTIPGRKFKKAVRRAKR